MSRVLWWGQRVTLAAALGMGGAAAASAPEYVDAEVLAGADRIDRLRQALVQGFDAVCGDTFCEGAYSNLQSMGLRCAVHHAKGEVVGCLWAFAGSETRVDPASGELQVDVRSFACPLPLAAGTSLEGLLLALEGVPVRRVLHVPLPGTSASVYDGLVDCL